MRLGERISADRLGFTRCWRMVKPVGKTVAEEDCECAGNEEEHGRGEDEAVTDPFAVEHARCLNVDRAEEACDAAGGGMGIEDAGVHADLSR